MDKTNRFGNEDKEPLDELEWQVDSEWVNLSEAGTGVVNLKTKLTKQSTSVKTDINMTPSINFATSSNGSRFLVVENQRLRLVKQSETGYSYWVCCIPCCNARCVLDPNDKIKHYCGEHTHNIDLSKSTYKIFINALKFAVKKNPQVKPKALYDAQVKLAKEQWRDEDTNNERELCLPDFDIVKTAMYNTRNAVLSSLSLKPVGEDTSSGMKESGESPTTRSQDLKVTSKRKLGSAKSAGASSSTDLEEMVRFTSYIC